jgi:hypothetical protein
VEASAKQNGAKRNGASQAGAKQEAKKPVKAGRHSGR